MRLEKQFCPYIFVSFGGFVVPFAALVGLVQICSVLVVVDQRRSNRCGWAISRSRNGSEYVVFFLQTKVANRFLGYMFSGAYNCKISPAMRISSIAWIALGPLGAVLLCAGVDTDPPETGVGGEVVLGACELGALRWCWW